MIPSRLMPPILKHEIKHRQRKKNQNQNQRNVEENRKTNVINGCKNKLKRKPTSYYMKRKLWINLTLIYPNCVLKFPKTHSGVLRKTPMVKMNFGMATKLI